MIIFQWKEKQIHVRKSLKSLLIKTTLQGNWSLDYVMILYKERLSRILCYY